MPIETAVPVGNAGSDQQVRNLIATVLVGGKAQTVMMQVVSLADQNGNLLDMDLARRMDSQLQLLSDMRTEMRIQTDLLSQIFASNSVPPNPLPDIDREYRADPYYSQPTVPL